MTTTQPTFKVKAGRRLYLAYGSNLSKRDMRRRCESARPVGYLILDNARLVFRSVADIEYCPGAQVPVGVWSITPQDERRLDSYEGVSSGYYGRFHIPVGDNRALIYFMRDRGIAPPGQEYYNTIARGYRDFGLDISFLEDALRRSYDDKAMTEQIVQRRRRSERHGKIVALPTGVQSS